MPQQNSLTRLLQVSAGLTVLADQLNKEAGLDPANLRYWSRELAEIHSEIEARYQVRDLPAGNGDTQ
jgi:hypothetical protein